LHEFFRLWVIPNLSGKYILISAFPHDPIVPRGGAKDLFNLLKKAGSNVSLQWQNSGHEITPRSKRCQRMRHNFVCY
jgi:predicted esterase